MVVLDDGRELPCDLFLGVPKNRAPDVVVATGLTENGWVTIDPRTLETKFPACTRRRPRQHRRAQGRRVRRGRGRRGRHEPRSRGSADQEPTAKNPGAGSCYIEFGANRIARVDVDFFSGPKPTGVFHEPSEALRADKEQFGATRRARWFGGA